MLQVRIQARKKLLWTRYKRTEGVELSIRNVAARTITTKEKLDVAHMTKTDI